MKELSHFYKHAQGADGHYAECKVCFRQRTAQYSKENADRVRFWGDQWRAANPEKVKASRLKWIAKDPEEFRERNRLAQAKWREAHPGLAEERNREYQRKWRAKKKARQQASQ